MIESVLENVLRILKLLTVAEEILIVVDKYLAT